MDPVPVGSSRNTAAHKFLTGSSPAALSFTEELLHVIRLERHLGTRVIIATQEPTLSPRLLELCSTTIIHRFTSPHWFKYIQGYIAGVSGDCAPLSEEEGRDGDDNNNNKKQALAKLFRDIVQLETGEGMLFGSEALVHVEYREEGAEKAIRPNKLGTGYLKIRTRKRLTADGGRSVLAT